MASPHPLRLVAALALVAAATVAAVASTATVGTAARASVGPTSTLEWVMGDPRIIESSGLALSTYDRPVMFTHNDSGDSPRIFAISSTGSTRATLTLTGARRGDFEDIAAGRGHSIWAGDIGDNARHRASVHVYRIVEPRRLVTSRVRATRYDLVYPDGRPHNAEALLVSHQSGRLFLATKARSGAALYQAPRRLSTTRVNRLTKVASVPALVTGGTFLPQGGYVLRTHSWAYVYRSWHTKAGKVRLPTERQGESVESNRAGTALYTGSEGRDSPVYLTPLG